MDSPYLISRVSVHKDKAEEFLALMQRTTEAATALGGAAEGFILRDAESPDQFTVIRRWESEAAMQRWFASAASRELWQKADDLIQSYEGSTAFNVFDIPLP
jgi:heme-degrading monooxygenase HmoA